MNASNRNDAWTVSLYISDVKSLTIGYKQLTIMQGSVNTCNNVHLKTQLIDGYVNVQTKNRKIQVKSTFPSGFICWPST